jgi:hypothetical protein
MAADLARDPVVLNDRWRVTADGLQWIAQKLKPTGRWLPVIYCQTQARLMANLRYKVSGVGKVTPDAWSALVWLHKHRRFAPGCTGVDVEAEIARARAQDRRHVKLTTRRQCAPGIGRPAGGQPDDWPPAR